MKSKPFTLNFQEFEKWKSEERILYASDGEKGTKLYCYLNGNIEVWKGNKIIWQGIQPLCLVQNGLN